jgi:SAM-dependent methyltransferase
MGLESVLLALISALVGAVVSVFAAYYFYHRQTLDRLKREREEDLQSLRREYDARLRHQADQRERQMSDLVGKHEREIQNLKAPGFENLREKVHSPMLLRVFMDKLRSVENYDIDMGVLETSALWGELFKQYSVVYLRTTSCIPVQIWNDEFMRKYEGEQRKAMVSLDGLRRDRPTEYEEIVGKAKTKLQNQFPALNLENNSERIYIIRGEHVANSSSLRELAERMSTQSTYMNVFVVHESKLPTEDTKDFGIAVSREGDLILYELIVAGNALHGGRVSLNPQKIEDGITRFSRLRGQANPIPVNTPVSRVIELVGDTSKSAGHPIEERIVEKATAEAGIDHKCLLCFLRTEILMGTLNSGQWQRFPDRVRTYCERFTKTMSEDNWRKFPTERQAWFRMIEQETKAVIAFVERTKPKRVIEIGCGPGRFIAQITQLKGYEYERIVGLDSDPLMIRIATLRFPDDEFPDVEIYNMRVVDKLPFRGYDLCINAMNIVGWQESETAWLREALRASRSVVFSLYKAGNEDLRKEMYCTRGHAREAVYTDTRPQIQLRDSATNPGVWSKAYQREDVERMCQEVTSSFALERRIKYSIDEDSSDLLYLCTLEATDE